MKRTGEATSASVPRRTRFNPLEEDVIIVDEYAMVPTGLHRDLVAAIGSACLRTFGDVRQLPPIENADLADPTSPFPTLFRETKHRHTAKHLPSSRRQRHH
jgi:hypothetical protein